MAATDADPQSYPTSNSFRKNPLVWTRCLEKAVSRQKLQVSQEHFSSKRCKAAAWPVSANRYYVVPFIPNTPKAFVGRSSHTTQGRSSYSRLSQCTKNKRFTIAHLLWMQSAGADLLDNFSFTQTHFATCTSTARAITAPVTPLFMAAYGPTGRESAPILTLACTNFILQLANWSSLC